jgi:hypothetical protein
MRLRRKSKGEYRMKTWKQQTLVYVIAFWGIIVCFSACPPDGGNGTKCNHNWEWVVTTPATTETEGLETEICTVCSETRGTRPIDKITPEQPIAKTYTISVSSKVEREEEIIITFSVKYEALPTDIEPTYLTYLEGRLGAIMDSTSLPSVVAVNYLISNGNHFTITMEYSNTLYEGIKWNGETETFEIHNNWISSASGTELSLAMLRSAFNAVGK